MEVYSDEAKVVRRVYFDPSNLFSEYRDYISVIKSKAHTPCKRLLIIGLMPPPIGGSGLTVQEINDELAIYTSLQVVLINTSPSSNYTKKMTGFKLEKIRRMIYVLLNYSIIIRYRI